MRTFSALVEMPEQTEAPEDDNTETEPAGDGLFCDPPHSGFDALRETGPDIIGWLSLPDTVLNYPVTQTDNNEYYLNHLYDGTYNKVGCLLPIMKPGRFFRPQYDHLWS